MIVNFFLPIRSIILPVLDCGTGGYVEHYYRQFSNISRTQFQNINGSRLILQLPLPNPLKPGVKLRMKM